MSDQRELSASIIEDRHFSRLKDYLIAATGLAYYHDRDNCIAELIGRRMSKAGLPDCASYSQRLAEGEAGRDELDALIADLTIGETYFFRDQQQFDALRDVAIPQILERNQPVRRLRIWSAGCANGAEPYSLAILLAREFGHRLEGWDVEIFATDINRQSLTDAQAGRFQEWALRSTSGAVKDECFCAQGRHWDIRSQYKQWIKFAHLNLVESEFPPVLSNVSPFDLILCRNVMIYFAPDVVSRLASQFHKSLADGGWFVAGAAEHNMETFRCFDTVSLAGATLYRRSGKALPETPTVVVPRPFTISADLPRLPEPANRAVTDHVAPDSSERYALSPALEELRRLADRGDWENAVPHCDRLLARDAMNPVVYFYRSLLLEPMGRADEAARSLRQAIYLEPNFLLAHYHLGLALAKGKQHSLAVRSFKNVLRLSGSARDGQILEYGDGLTVAGLKAMAKMHIENLGNS